MGCLLTSGGDLQKQSVLPAKAMLLTFKNGARDESISEALSKTGYQF